MSTTTVAGHGARTNHQTWWLRAWAPPLAAAGVAITFALLYRDVVHWLVDDWDVNGNYSHGFLIVPIALYLAWERRDDLRAAPLRPSRWGLGTLLVAMTMLLLGTVAAETFVQRVSIVLTVAGAIWFVAGIDHLRVLRFPVAFLLLMIPIPSLIFNQIAFPLQLVASRFGEAALTAASVPVLREGNLIILPNMVLEVAEACSGIRSLVSLFALSVLYSYLFESRTAARILLVLSTIPIAIFVNGLRVATTGFVAHYYGAKFAEGFYHASTGWAMFVVAGLMIVALRALIDVSYGMARPPMAAGGVQP